MACVAPEGINKAAWDAKLILTADLASSCELCPPGSPTDGTALPFVLECLLYGSPLTPTAHPSHLPTPYRLSDISDITAIEKNYLNNQGYSNS